jgi:hypothetical protein
METTLAEQTLESYRLSNYESLQINISAFLAEYIARRGVLSLVEFEQNPVLDFTYFKALLTSDASIAGIDLFAPSCKKLIFPDISPTAITQGGLNVSEFRNIEVLAQKAIGSGQIFSGDMSTFTKLVELNIYFNSAATAYKSTLPTLSNNTQLKTVYLGGNAGAAGLTSLITVANVGNLQGNLQLTSFSLTTTNSTNATVKAAVDNILTTLREQKLAGGLISVINLSGTAAPTGGAANADAVWLANNGVTVTLGTV